MSDATIPAPSGQTFYIPGEPENTREHAKWICEQVFAGEYEATGLPKDISTVIDIGAHCGAFAVWSLARWPSITRIDCYDPNAEALSFAVRNVHAPHVHYHPVAVTTAQRPRFACAWDWGSAKTFEIGPDDGVTVESTHPRDLPEADLLKCDAEGVEVEVLTEYAHWSSLKALIYEYHNLPHRGILRSLCESRGFHNLREDDSGTYGASVWVPNDRTHNQ